jgi:hypothetical protein
LAPRQKPKASEDRDGKGDCFIRFLIGFRDGEKFYLNRL